MTTTTTDPIGAINDLEMNPAVVLLSGMHTEVFVSVLVIAAVFLASVIVLAIRARKRS